MPERSAALFRPAVKAPRRLGGDRRRHLPRTPGVLEGALSRYAAGRANEWRPVQFPRSYVAVVIAPSMAIGAAGLPLFAVPVRSSLFAGRGVELECS